MFIVHAKHIAEFAVTQRLPTIGFREFVEAGGLAAYAVDLDDMWRRSMALVDKIFRGAKPGDLPIQQATNIRVCHQPQDREGARPDNPAISARPG